MIEIFRKKRRRLSEQSERMEGTEETRFGIKREESRAKKEEPPGCIRGELKEEKVRSKNY